MSALPKPLPPDPEPAPASIPGAQALDRAGVYRQALRDIIHSLSAYHAPAAPAAGDGVPVALDSARGLRALFRHILSCLLRALSWDQGALVLLDEDQDAILLVASTAGSERVQFPLGPRECPELRAALRSGRPALLRDPRDRARLAELLQFADPSEAPPGTLLCLPGPAEDRGEGLAWLLLLHTATPDADLDEEAREFLAMGVQVTALGLRGRQVIEAFRDRTRRISLQRHAAERRREAILHYRDFFESSADGIMVLDQAGRVLYLNRMAEQLTGYAAAGLHELPILDIIPEPQSDGLLEVVRQVVSQVTLLPFDLQLTTTSGEVLVLSVSTSSVLSEHGLAVLSFRDVTEQRVLEHQLRGTKEFLERLIDSTVDAIIAADMRGQVILFNQGAARLTGYAAEEVLGKLPVWHLYPEGEARRIMAQLRADEHGGPGRLLLSRRVILGKSGEHIPVSLSASIVYDQGREVATVGILSDLRERLHIEERLQKAQERLALSEKQALVAEVAGAAAHELNQPLTSVLGYAGLLRRKLLASRDRDPQQIDFIDVVLRETERMAEIVRKIGRITRYETKPYIGESRILDLDKAAPEPADLAGAAGEEAP